MCQEDKRYSESSSAGNSGNCAPCSAGSPIADAAPTGPTGSGCSTPGTDAGSAATSASNIPASIPRRDGLLLGLRAKRCSRGLTLGQLADACHVNGAHLSQIERGIKLASLPLAVRLARALECGVRDLLAEPDLFGGRRGQNQ
mgnify:CR=1 FL=1